ncbi:MAG: alpha/beta hydrolase family protein [Methylobacter sp.]
MNKTRSIKVYFLAAITCTAFLSGCFFRPSPPSQEQQTEKIGQFIAKGGYSAAHSYTIDTVRETWRHDGQAIEITLLAPTAKGRYPLVIYLPGLGEHADGGRLWRETWAKAGYAVLSIQPLEIAEALKELAPMLRKPGSDEEAEIADEDKQVPFGESGPRPSLAAKSSEMHYLGREYFSQQALKKRINHLLWAYAQLKLRAKAEQSLFASADESRLIIAGYDIGAQTAAAMIGEKFDTALPQAQDFKPLAAMLFSPSVDMSLGSVATRYKNIAIPLLVVTGTEDDDPYGISSPYVRTAIWEYAPPGNKYLLLLNKGGHQLLSGASFSYRKEPGPDQDGGERFGGAMPSHLDSHFQGGGRPGGPPGGMGGGRPPHNGRHDDDQDAKHIAAVFSLSSAFMDSISRSDNSARSWIAEKANQWLKKSSSLKIK